MNLGAWDGAYLLSLVESLAVTVGQVHGTGHHPRAGFELLQGSLHVSAAGALCADRRDERHGRTRWKPPTCAEHVAWAGLGRGEEWGARGSQRFYRESHHLLFQLAVTQDLSSRPPVMQGV